MEKLTRRQFLRQIGAQYGVAGLGFVALNAGLVSDADAARRDQGHLPPDTGKGRRVAVLGAGVSGLRAAWELAAGGFDVTVIEAAPYMGGRSQTIRPSSERYKAFWLNEYNQRNFPEGAYHDTLYQDVRDEEGNVLRTETFTCEFQDDAFEAGDVDRPDEIYLNAGPGRIPSFHNAVLDHSAKFDVKLEPFTFTSRQNLMQKDGFNDSDATKLGRIKHSLRLRIEEILESLDQDALDAFVDAGDMEAFEAMVADFGGAGTERICFKDAETPGSWFNGGTLRQDFSLTEILEAEAWKPGLFNDMRVYWQISLMQPTGGMDRLWTNILTKELPQGGTIEPMVQINAPVTRLEKTTAGVDISWGHVGAERREGFDFCVSTMGPKQLARVVAGFCEEFELALDQVLYTPACKVGWQSRGRWFEEDLEIYGGISWIADTSSPDQSLISQVWYPSQDFMSRNAVLTGAYNSGQSAVWFGDLSPEERLERAAIGGAKLHSTKDHKVSVDEFKTEKVYYDRGMSVAWAHAPYQNGGWSDHGFETRHATYVQDGVDTGRPLWDMLVDQGSSPLYLAGDYFSHTPGWQEGSLRTALAAVYAIAEKCTPQSEYNGGDGGNCRYEKLFPKP